jgi:hypothetical protein
MLILKEQDKERRAIYIPIFISLASKKRRYSIQFGEVFCKYTKVISLIVRASFKD